LELNLKTPVTSRVSKLNSLKQHNKQQTNNKTRARLTSTCVLFRNLVVIPVMRLLISLTIFITVCFGKDKIPRGYDPASEFESVREEAIDKGKLLTILVHGKNSCGNCETAVESGEKAVKTSSEILFCRVQEVKSGKSGLPEEVIKKMGSLTYGYSVHFFVYDPNTLDLVAKATRKILPNDKTAVREFKNTVREARKALKE